jgi:hypothetical protein
MTTVYIHLLNENVDVWVPVDAEHVRDDVYRLVDCRGTKAEFEFGEGMLVRCRIQLLSEGLVNEECLVAYEAVG